MGSDKAVAFEMITDNVTTTRSQLDSIRMRKSKFVCVSDNLENPTPELQRLLRDFFESFFPFPSPFEVRSPMSSFFVIYYFYSSILFHVVAAAPGDAQ